MNNTPNKPRTEQEAFAAYLDNPNDAAAREEAAELIAMMESIEAIEAPDPGQEYWNQFNHRLQQRLENRPRKRARFSWRFFFGGWQTTAFAFAGLLVLGFLLMPSTPRQSDLNPSDNQWAQMSEQDLAFIDQLYSDDYLDGNLSDLVESDVAQLLDDLGEDSQFLERDGDLPLDENFDSEAFKSLWNAEG
ncbi:hypothetical protein [Acanthopleuribacter pedis]|uniref:Transmembrane protein n=1 Tax=Acanthopleuribacter pedis TaxID=442870 RepID=A0A8J7Q947_9BACT|nr:hypothetical protein [Acanthopleuribacter pedis]MBO1320175.1 hypothetical protein [Acanthopleuribacter pedis]